MSKELALTKLNDSILGVQEILRNEGNPYLTVIIDNLCFIRDFINKPIIKRHRRSSGEIAVVKLQKDLKRVNSSINGFNKMLISLNYQKSRYKKLSKYSDQSKQIIYIDGMIDSLKADLNNKMINKDYLIQELEYSGISQI